MSQNNQEPRAYPIKLCKCGCGLPTKIAKETNTRLGWIKGIGIPYVNGHNRRKNLVIKTSAGYLMEYCPDHLNADGCKRVAQHRLILEKYLERYLEIDEVPHHCNEKKDDNRIENIELMLVSGPESHNSIHKKGNTINLGRKPSDETKRKISESKRNCSDEMHKQMSERQKRLHKEGRGGGFKKGNTINIGRECSQETKIKISEKKKARDLKKEKH